MEVRWTKEKGWGSEFLQRGGDTEETGKIEENNNVGWDLNGVSLLGLRYASRPAFSEAVLRTSSFAFPVNSSVLWLNVVSKFFILGGDVLPNCAQCLLLTSAQGLFLVLCFGSNK